MLGGRPGKAARRVDAIRGEGDADPVGVDLVFFVRVSAPAFYSTHTPFSDSCFSSE